MTNIYKSSADGKNKFEKLSGEFVTPETMNNLYVVKIVPEVQYQEILGFGGAFTEAASSTYSKMSKENRELIIKAYFDEKEGLGYNFCRTHIGSCDFSLNPYSYVEEGDETLETFDMSRDKETLIPMMLDAKKYSDYKLFASPWSPPAYMKDNKELNHGGKLLEEYYELWTKYVVKYIEGLKENGIELWGVTIQNEPRASQPWESCFYSAKDECALIKSGFGKKMKELGIKIFAWDHNKDSVFDRANEIFSDKDAEKYVDGIGFHWYSGEHFEELEMAKKTFPDKYLITSEICAASSEKGVKYKDGAMFAEKYGHELMGNFNNGCSAFCDWNMVLNEENGPFHWRPGTNSYCDAPIIADTKNDKVVFEPTYYYIGHFSKFVKPGAVRIGTSRYNSAVETCAFKNPDGSIITVAMNRSDEDKFCRFRLNGKDMEYTLEKHSIITIVNE